MNTLQTLESKIDQLYSHVPQLPLGGKRWLGNNIWWIVLIFAIFGVFGTLQTAGSLVAALLRKNHTDIYLNTATSLSPITLIISLISSITTTTLYFVALSPLMNKRKRGWNLVFYAQLFDIVVSVVTLVLTVISGSSAFITIIVVLGFIVGLVIEAIWLYFLFQARPEFTTRVSGAVEAEIIEKK